jgi:DNA-binding MarR family transcriptional regulator
MAAADEQDDEVRMVLQRVARRIRRNRNRDDLTASHLSVLFLLEAGYRSPSELADLERVSPPSMNRTLNTLERAGLLVRHRDELDARRVRVSLTEPGAATVAQTRALRTEWFSQRMHDLSEAEREALLAAVPVLRRIAEQ